MQTLLDGKLLTDKTWVPVKPRYGALVVQGDESHVRLDLFLKIFEYLIGTFRIEGHEVVGGTLLAVGPPRVVPKGAASTGAAIDPRKLIADAGLVRRIGHGSDRLAYYLSPNQAWNDRIIAMLMIAIASGGPSSDKVSARPQASPANGNLASNGERAVAEALDRMAVTYETQYTISNPVPFGTRYRADFYLPDLRLVVEYDGEYHFPRSFGPGGPSIPSSGVERDVYKTLRCLENDIGVLRVAKGGIREFEALTAVHLAEIGKRSTTSRRPQYMPDTVLYKAHKDSIEEAFLDSKTWLLANLPAIVGDADRKLVPPSTEIHQNRTRRAVEAPLPKAPAKEEKKSSDCIVA
jgi:hypothetical protein